MRKYKIKFSGIAYVEANSEEDAKWDFDPDDCAYSEVVIDDIEEVDEFVVEW